MFVQEYVRLQAWKLTKFLQCRADTDNNGAIDRDECFAALVRLVGEDQAESSLDDIFSSIDTDANALVRVRVCVCDFV
jgi:Ca2+-binding EF-hand superfamily protein